MDRFDVKIIELHGRRHAVVEFKDLRSQESAIRLASACTTYGERSQSGWTTGPRPSHWVQLGAQYRRNKGPWLWVGETTAKKMGVDYFMFMADDNHKVLKGKT